MKKLWEYLPELAKAMNAKLKLDDTRWGDTWLKRMPEGQDERFANATLRRIDQCRYGGQPMDYLSIIGDAFICWLRTQHPELWDKSKGETNELQT